MVGLTTNDKLNADKERAGAKEIDLRVAYPYETLLKVKAGSKKEYFPVRQK
jgi:hypothetical protein